jgi:hypothetical protein
MGREFRTKFPLVQNRFAGRSAKSIELVADRTGLVLRSISLKS